MINNIVFFSVSEMDLDLDKLLEEIEDAEFTPCAKLQRKSEGFLPPAGGDTEFVRNVNGNLLIQFVQEEKKISAAAVAVLLEAKVDEHRQRHGGELPTKAEMKTMKSDIMLEMLPQAFAERKSTFIFIPSSYDFIAIGATGERAAEEILSILRSKVTINANITSMVPTRPVESVVTSWIETKSIPQGVNLEESITLKGEQDGSVVTCKNVDPLGDEVKSHLDEMRKVSKVRVTLNEESSFTFDNTLVVKSLKHEASLKPEAPEGHNEMTPEALMTYMLDTSMSLLSGQYSTIFTFLNDQFVIGEG